MLSEHRTQRPVQYVGTSVITTSCSTGIYIYPCSYYISFIDFSGDTLADMSTKTRKCEVCVNYGEHSIWPNDGANVSDLSTAFCIERRVINEYFDLIIVTIDDGNNSAFSNIVNITHKLGNAV